MAKKWRVCAHVKQYHVQVVEAETAEEAWKVAYDDWGSETCVEWDAIERDGDPEEMEDEP